MTAQPAVYLARHGETAWTLSGQHTGLTDIALTPHGEVEARVLGERLRGIPFDRVYASPLMRAARTCELAGFKGEAMPDLVEWDYGELEGLTSAEIRRTRPGWLIFKDGAAGGESVADVQARADRVIAQLRQVGGTTLVFSSGHFLRALAARWCGADIGWGSTLLLSPASLSILSYDHNLDEPAIRLWNSTDDHHREANR